MASAVALFIPYVPRLDVAAMEGGHARTRKLVKLEFQGARLRVSDNFDGYLALIGAVATGSRGGRRFTRCVLANAEATRLKPKG